MLIGLYGAGTLGRRIGRSLAQPFIFVDDTPEKAGTSIDGHEVVSLGEFAKRAPVAGACLYVCIYQPSFSFLQKREEIENSFPGLDCRPFTELLLNVASGALPFLFFEEPALLSKKLGRYRELGRLFADDLSRITLDAHLKFRLTGDFGDLVSTPRDDVAFLRDRMPATISYVDAGAFDGDTAEDFINLTRGRFRHIYLVEPDPVNVERARLRLGNLGVADRTTIRQEAVSSTRGVMRFNALGSVGSSLDTSGKQQVPTVLLSDLDTGGPTYIKLDIEGSESGAVRASLDFIASGQIFLGISVYHLPDDLLDIGSMIHDLDAGYELFLRCHGRSGEDLMLYAIPARAYGVVS